MGLSSVKRNKPLIMEYLINGFWLWDNPSKIKKLPIIAHAVSKTSQYKLAHRNIKCNIHPSFAFQHKLELNPGVTRPNYVALLLYFYHSLPL